MAGEGPRLNHLAFVIVCESAIGCQHLCRQFERALGRCSLRLNADKFRTLRIAVNGKAKKWVCDPTPFLSLAGVVLPAVSISQGYKYLGVTVSARERDSTPEELLNRGLNQLTRAPLKPQQRLYILRAHLIPKLHHRLVLSRTRGGVLRRLDKLVRRRVRAWIKLPHDTTNCYIHADVKEGGMGIPSLRTTIPFMKRDRLRRLSTSEDPMISHGDVHERMCKLHKATSASRVCHSKQRDGGQKGTGATTTFVRRWLWVGGVCRRCLLRYRCDALQPLSVAFLDVSTAFDSVSHASLLLAAERMGVPGRFISYLRSLYTEASTVLQVDGQLSGPMVQNRGVKQGDPLSPLLFNCVIDWALRTVTVG